MHSVTIPSSPPAPWLRLAHVARYDAPGMAAGARRLGDWQFFAVLSGSTWMECGDGRADMPAGSVALIPPGLVFDWGLERHAHLAVHFDLHAGADPSTGPAITYLPGRPGPVTRQAPGWNLRCGGASATLPLVRPAPPGSWGERFAPLLRLWSRGGAHSVADRLRAAGILATAVADWLALGRGSGRSVPGTPDSVERVRLLLDALATAPSDLRLGVPALASRCRLGVVAFRSAFRAATGQSPRRWLERRRIETVLGMLDDPRVPVAQAARLAGYDDPFHFARVVRRVTGSPPSARRRSAL